MPIAFCKNCFSVVNHARLAGTANFGFLFQESFHIVRAAHPYDVTVRHILSKQPFALRNAVQELHLARDVTVLVLQQAGCKCSTRNPMALLYKMPQYFIAARKTRPQMAMGYSILYVKYLNGVGSCRDASAM